MILDLKHLCLLIFASICLGFLINTIRPTPLELIYTIPSQQITEDPKSLSFASDVSSVVVIGMEEVIQAVQSRSHIVVDARPNLFWKLGHIPGAINISTKQFDDCYSEAEPILLQAATEGRPLLLYCADLHCPDAGRLANMLHERGFQDIFLFEAGWAAWEKAGQTVETK